MKKYVGDAAELVQEALPIAITISDNAGVPGLSIGLDASLTILDKIEVCRHHTFMR